MAAAGAYAVSMVSPGKMFLLRDTEGEMPLEKVKDMLSEVDIILTEGFLSTAREKIEIVRRGNGEEPLCRADELSALVTDVPLQMEGPLRIHLDDIRGLADFLECNFITSQD